MNKTIIALQGKGSIGKTTTIRKFRDILLIDYPCHNERSFTNNGNKDMKVIITITHKCKKVKIGIESQGDPTSRLVDENLKDFISEDCDIIICACRTSGETVNIINQVASKHKYNVVFTSPYISKNNQDALNKLMAQHLLNFVEKHVLNG